VLLCGVALIWGASFLLIEIGLESLEPATITWVRVTLGFLVLTVFPAAREPIERADYSRVVVLGFVWPASMRTQSPGAQPQAGRTGAMRR